MSIPTRQARIKELAKVADADNQAIIHGDPEVVISGIATLDKADDGDLTFLSNRKYYRYLTTSRASLVILHADDLEQCPTNALVVNDPYLAYARVAAWLTAQKNSENKIATTAVIEAGVTLGDNVCIGANVTIAEGSCIGDGVTIGPGCSIGRNVSIGSETLINANVTIYNAVKIGRSGIIHSGAVLGSDGFGIANDQGQWVKVPQLGTVVVGDEVEIGANTTIDRGAIEDTVIEDGVKLDNLIQIAHNVRIGENTAIAGCVGIAGSTSIGKYCAIGGGAGILGHLHITDYVHITATSLVTKSIKKPGVYSSGTPLQENAVWHKNFARYKQLDNMARRLIELEKRLESES
jgi:UDP-3-O-[3-hydroxymyristoyl] glucosamine N-acyltransferase